MALYAKVDVDTCIGCGNCEGIAPDIFDLDEEGLAYIKLDDNQGVTPIPEDQEEDLREAAEECPTSSIVLQGHPLND
ncbi:ferredoxin [Gracilibacillus caseinilyticus]|uniref:Ferredoxin n=1 Tax=Gracilibacillus caseinilyticus TaxID=2932256 RepID=A0ABY4EXM4_9BACI|nr:ferredoxin [Gracilibacillus caseinilyticus]UOQ49161.1 ferredoxin [Gracilibacillus caseinilyticus]